MSKSQRNISHAPKTLISKHLQIKHLVCFSVTALKKMSSGIDMVLYFATSTAVAIERLTGRRVCKSCGFNYHVKNIPPKKEGICDKCGGALFQRPDDNEETVRKRLKVYEDQTKPLIDFYMKQGILKRVSGDMGVDELFKVLSKIFSDAKLA